MTRLERLFEAINSDCDLEPLFKAILKEEHLMEMAVINMQYFVSAFESRVINAVKTKVDLNDDVLNDFISRVVIDNHRTIKSPFAVVDENNNVLVINDASDAYFNNLSQLIKNRYKNYKILKINNEQPIKDWINTTTDNILKNRVLMSNIAKTININEFKNIVQNNFNQLYLALQRDQSIHQR